MLCVIGIWTIAVGGASIAGEPNYTTILPPHDGSGGVYGLYGSSVDIQGDLMAVAAGGAGASGIVYMYRLVGGTWTKVYEVRVPNGALTMRVALSAEETLVVGARYASGTDGIAHVFEKGAEDNWEWSSTLYPPDQSDAGLFGTSVDVDGSLIVVGDPDASSGGAAYVFSRSDGIWAFASRLTLANAHDDALFGYSVAVNGHRAMVATGTESQSPVVVLFELRADGEWVNARSFSEPDGGFRSAVRLSDTHGLFGGYSGETPGVYVFELSGESAFEPTFLTHGVSGLVAGRGFEMIGTEVAAAFVSEEIGSCIRFFSWNNGEWTGDPCTPVSNPDHLWTVDFNATSLVTTYYLDETVGTRAGRAFAYSRESLSEVQELFETGPAFMRFGHSSDIFESTIAISSLSRPEDWSPSGFAYVWELMEGEWELTAQLGDGERNGDDYYGFDVSLAENQLAVSATEGGPGSRGIVYYYKRDGSHWQYVSSAVPDDAVAARFGKSVVVNGDFLIVGAPGPLPRYPNERDPSGAVYVFLSSGNTWLQVQRIDTPGAAGFGYSLAVSDDILLVGSAFSKEAYVFQRHGDQWLSREHLTVSGLHDSTAFGADVSLDGSTALIGAPRASYQYTSTQTDGRAFIFDIESGYSQELLSGDVSSIYFGRGTAIDSNYAVVGPPERGYFLESGLSINIRPSELGTFVGQHASLSGGRLVIANAGDSSTAYQAGAVYVLDLDLPLMVDGFEAADY